MRRPNAGNNQRKIALPSPLQPQRLFDVKYRENRTVFRRLRLLALLDDPLFQEICQE